MGAGKAGGAERRAACRIKLGEREVLTEKVTFKQSPKGSE